MTQEQLADHARMGVRTIRNLERGTARPRQASVQLLADAMRLEATDRSTFERAGAPRPGASGEDEGRRVTLPWRRLSRKGIAAVSFIVLAVLVATTLAAVYWIWPAPPPGPGSDPSPPPCPPTRNSQDHLSVGACLGVGRELVSQATTLAGGERRSYRLTLNSDFDLVLYEVTSAGGTSTSKAVWETGTAMCGSSVKQHPGFAVLRPDGNFVLYSKENVIVWASDTSRRPLRVLAIQPDGNLVLRSTDGKITSDRHHWRPGCRIGQCTQGYFCLYDRSLFRGRVVQFKDCGSVQDLSSWSFANKASSWINKTSKPVDVYGEARFHLLGLQLGDNDRLWRAAPLSAASFVGNQNNDRARTFRLLC